MMQLRVAAACVAVLPSWVWACPACANRDGGSGTLYWVGAMMALPFVLAAVGVRWARKLGPERGDSPE
ncbi:MAG TPA: hypothetical protein VEY30_08720 [Myxococcaceae bacterium]|nr:hypothetical protein [Myxococcaceae bacterium]